MEGGEERGRLLLNSACNGGLAGSRGAAIRPGPPIYGAQGVDNDWIEKSVRAKLKMLEDGGRGEGSSRRRASERSSLKERRRRLDRIDSLSLQVPVLTT